MELFPDSDAAGGTLHLSSLKPNQQADIYALLAAKERATTRDGKPYFRVTFRDHARSATVMVWSDTGWFADCEAAWQPGRFYKLRCRYAESQYGPQLELDRIREVNDEDQEAGFNPDLFFISSRFDVDEMFDELIGIVHKEIQDKPLRRLVLEILKENESFVRSFPAASRNHHAFRGGFLEHTLSVTKTALYLADKYRDYYPGMQPPLSKDLILAGAVLHDIGKAVELDGNPAGSSYTPPGRLIGHILLGRDMVREKAAQIPELDPDLLLRLEHIIVAHQNLPEWGSPIAPHTPEALLVHFADDTDAKFHMMATLLEAPPEDDSPFTSRSNALRRHIYRGPVVGDEEA